MVVSEPTRLAPLVGSLVLATDLSAGFPAETALRTALLSVRLARAASLDRSALSHAYWAGCLRFLGCTAYAHEAAQLNAGDDIQFLAAFADVDFGRPTQVLGRTIATLGKGHGARARVQAVARFVADPRGGTKVATSHCEQAAHLALSMGLDTEVGTALSQAYERWDGRGEPRRVSGPELSPVARVVHVAQVAEVHHRIGGRTACVNETKRRRGAHLDPALCDVFAGHAEALLAGLDAASVWDAYLNEEPAPARTVAETRSVAAAFGRFADLKSPFTLDHSTRVAELAVRAARERGLDQGTTDALERAALLHDVGRVSVPNGIWDKPGPLNAAEWERVRAHAYQTERLLAQAPTLRSLVDIAGADHERVDGSGYPRRVGDSTLTAPSRLLAACDVWCALTEDRAHRPAHAPANAEKILTEEVHAGRLDRDAVAAVLAALGSPSPQLRVRAAGGLSEREIEVLCWVARGLTNKEVATKLGLSPRTVQTHLEHVFQKTGVATRAAAALFAVENGLLGRLRDTGPS